MKEISIIIPAHNEQDNLKILIPDMLNVFAGQDYEIVIVNNASTDDTQKVIDDFKLKNPRLLSVIEPKLGYGGAVLTGLEKSQGHFLGIIRADNQEKPEDMLKMFEHCLKNNIEFCKAVRKSRRSEGYIRVVTTKVYNLLFKIFFNIPVRDINATPKIFSRKFYNEAKLQSKDWFIDAEMVIRANDLKYKMTEFEIEYRPRMKGKTSVKPSHVFQFLRNMLHWRSTRNN